VRRRGEEALWRAPGRHHARPVARGRFWARLGTSVPGQCGHRLGQGRAGSASGGSGEVS
jgi:hypothetical protein